MTTESEPHPAEPRTSQPRLADVPHDVLAAFGVTLLAVPQGVAYALIAGLPPVAGLMASTLPTVVGSLARSSRHVIAGPSNALSLLVGGSLVAVSDSPTEAALTLALLVGALQLLAGVLRLGPVVDFLSGPVILGYVTGAGVLIGVGQLGNGTGIAVARGSLGQQLSEAFAGLAQLHGPTLALALGTAAVMLLTRRFAPKWPAAVVGVVLGTVASVALDLPAMGVKVLGDVAAVPRGLPTLTVPDLSMAVDLWPAALACTVLSLVESSAVANTIARDTRQPLDPSREFAGQGLANIAAAFVGGFPTSGSLARSSLNFSLGARTRLAGVFSGLGMVGVLLFMGGWVEHIPVPVLAGMLWVVASRLVDVPMLRTTWQGRLGDRAALVGTMVGTWVLPLDRAIGVGVLISLVLFLRRVRMLKATEMGFAPSGRLVELEPTDEAEGLAAGPVRLVHVEGPLFFGSARELERVLDEVMAAPGLKVCVVRLKRTQALDVTAAGALLDVAKRAHRRQISVLLAGVSEEDLALLDRVGVVDALGSESVFVGQAEAWVALRSALDRAVVLAGSDSLATHPVRRWLDQHETTGRT